MKTKTITFNGVQLQMYDRAGKLVMHPDHDRCFNFAGLNKLILSGDKDRLFVYLPGYQTKHLNRGGWSMSFEVNLQIQKDSKVQAVDDFIVDEDRWDFELKNLDNILDFIADVLECKIFDQSEMQRIYMWASDINSGSWTRGFSEQYLFDQMLSRQRFYKPDRKFAPKLTSKPSQPSNNNGDLTLEELAHHFGIQLN